MVLRDPGRYSVKEHHPARRSYLGRDPESLSKFWAPWMILLPRTPPSQSHKSRTHWQYSKAGLEILSLITLLCSNLGTKSYVLRSLWNLLLSNSRLFSPGYTLSPRFLSPGAHAEWRTCVTRDDEPRPVSKCGLVCPSRTYGRPGDR